jgi:hypothetical protein
MACVLIHHARKGTGDNSYRGSTAIGAAVELGFSLKRKPNDPEGAIRRELRCFKCRPAPEPEPRWLALHTERGQVFIEAAEPFQGDEKEGAGKVPPPRHELAPDLLEAASEPRRWPEIARALDRDPKNTTLRRLRDDLVDTGELEKLEDGRWRRCQSATTPKGNGTVAPGTLPDWIDDPALTAAEREGLQVAQTMLVDTGLATWTGAESQP